MRTFIPMLRRIIFASVLFIIASAASYLGYEHWQQRERDKERWSQVVDEFKRCELFSTLYHLGFHPPSEVVGYLRNQLENDELGNFLTAQPTNLEDVWLDPTIKDSLGYNKGGDTSINLLDQCSNRIKEGHASVWLDVGKYYLATGNPGAIKWLNSATESGVADAEVLVGHAYRTGLISSIKDEKQAFIHYMKAANAGSPKAQLYVGELMASVNPQVARKYVVAAAHSGNLAAAYALQNPNHFTGASINEASLKSYYYWNLIFTSLHRSAMKTFMDSIGSHTKSSNLSDEASEFVFDGLPSTPTKSKYFISKRETVQRYDIEAAELNGKWLEGQLNADSRIQVQEYAKQWIDGRSRQIEEESKSVTTQAIMPKVNLPQWKPVITQICEGRPLSGVQTGADLFKNFKPYVWTVTAKSVNSSSSALGTAVAIGPNTLATNCHVVGAYEDITVAQDGVTHKASIASSDAKKDACLLEVKARVPFAVNSLLVSKLEVGTASYALGNPQGMNLTFSNGIISGVRKSDGREFIQTTAPISKGSSGGALIDDRGNLLGITTFYLQGGQAMNFAIPIGEFCKQ